MALTEYNRKRDFNKTEEPKGVKRTSGTQLRFVVQKHAASHLHYDFRLEIDGVLVSWAVPKGPSRNPEDKRLAMHVEDHPMDYMDFEGTIPQGEYGGGTVMVWDIGTYRPEGSDDAESDTRVMRRMLQEGSIKITLEGKKLKGSWALVRMHGKKGNEWLLIKHKDRYAGKSSYPPNSILTGRDFDAISHQAEPHEGFQAADLAAAKKRKAFPTSWSPQLATLAQAPFDSDDWLFETKYDGYRALAQLRDGKVQLLSRNGLSFNTKFPEITEALAAINADAILDGEIVVREPSGKTNFQWLQNRGENKRGDIAYVLFDVLYFDGYDLRGLDLLQRRKILKALIPDKHEGLEISQATTSHGIAAFEKAEKAGWEGIIAKRISSHYQTGKRSRDWLKIKTGKQQEMVIGGFTEPSGSRSGIGALLCGYYDGKKLIYAGKVGTGFTDAVLRDLRTKLEKIERKTTPFAQLPQEKHVHWVRPAYVANLRFSEFTESGTMRHPVFQGLREDKKASEVTLEQPSAAQPATKKTSVRKTSERKPSAKSGKVTFSNRDKIFWPELKITKGDVIRYYDAMAGYILPFLKDRPQSMRRNPDGILSDGFFQKNVEGLVPDWAKTVRLDDIEWLVCNDKDTLLYMANLGCIEINPWSSRTQTPEHPDYIIFDLDPKDAPVKHLIKTANTLKEILDELHVTAFLKTSGGNGLHVFIPVAARYTYDQTREFSHLVSKLVHNKLPDITSLERLPAKRKGKVYLDYLQNGKGKTMASVYSLRPRANAGVSTPLEWEELTPGFDPAAHTLFTIAARLKEKGDLWKDFLKSPLKLTDVLKSLS